MVAAVGLDGGEMDLRRRVSLSLTSQFAITGSIIMVAAMIAAGMFTSHTVTQATIENTAASTALFVNNLLEPLTQDLAREDLLPADKLAAIDHLVREEDFRERFPHVEIWNDKGAFAYSTSRNMIGRTFSPPVGLTRALTGEVAAHYTDPQAREHRARGFDEGYLEVYIPLRETGSGRVIAVAEVHETTKPLTELLGWLRLKVWIAIAGATMAITAGLFGIVYRGSCLILTQQRQLQERMSEIEMASRDIRILKERVQRASGRVAEMAENHLRRIGADLHDGPAQLIGLASLKVEHVRCAPTQEARERELEAMGTYLSDALNDIRAMSKGLVLPEIEGMHLHEIVARVVRNHERRTGMEVSVRCTDFPLCLPRAVKLCVYRFIQEGLSNAYRHAGGNGQVVTCAIEGAVLTVLVEDSGGSGDGKSHEPDHGLGLIGLRERVESLGGTFHVERRPMGGTRVEMKLVIEEGNGYE